MVHNTKNRVIGITLIIRHIRNDTALINGAVLILVYSPARGGTSAERYLNGMFAAVEGGDNVSGNGLAVYRKVLDSGADVAGVLYLDIVDRVTELTGHLKAVPLVRNGRVDLQAVVLRLNSENILRDRYEIPSRRTGKPRVFSLAVTLAVLARDHLRVNVRLGAVKVAHLLAERGGYLGVILKRLVSVSHSRFRADYPRVVVAEYAGVLLITARIGGDLAVLNLICGERGIVQYQTVPGVQVFVDALKGLDIIALVLAETCQNAPALRLDEDLALLALVRAYLVAVVVVCAEEPLAVIAELYSVLAHFLDLSLGALSLSLVALETAHSGVLGRDKAEHTRDHHGLRRLRIVGRVGEDLLVVVGLEALARLVGEAGEVQAVVPVGASRKRQTVRSYLLAYVVERALAVVKHGVRKLGFVLIRYLLVENRNVARLLDILRHREYHPQRVVVEVGAQLVIAHLGERLVLVVSAAVLEHGSREVDKALSRSFGDLVYEAEQVLVGVAEAHTASDTALEIRSGTAHIERYHTLVLVPDIYHAVDLLVGRVYTVLGEQTAPVFLKALEQLVSLFGGVAALDHLQRLLLVDDVGERLFIAVPVNGVGSYDVGVIAALVELFSRGHLHISKAENQVLALAGRKLQLDIVRSYGRPALGYGVVRLAVKNSVGVLKAVVQPEEALAVGVEALHGYVYGVESEVVAALPVLRLVVDGRALYLDLAGVVVSLEVGGIVVCVPQAPLKEAGELEGLPVAALVGDGDLLDLAVKVLRYEELHGSGNAVLLAGDNGVAQTVTALVAVKLGLYGRPAGVPHGISVLDVEIASAHIHGDVVIAVTGDAAKSSVLVEAVAACRIGDQ